MALAMQMTSVFISVLILYHSATTILAQDANFISLDCGSLPGRNYTQDGITYISDDGYIDNSTASGKNNDRSFPDNARNCYTLRPRKGKNNKYLIRTVFSYGDPRFAVQFDLYIGTVYWATLSFAPSLTQSAPEIIHLSTSDFIHVCLVNIDLGNPFISKLELRPLDITMYQGQSQALALSLRLNFGTSEQVRYQDDKYDRIWYAYPPQSGSRAIEASDAVVLEPYSEENVPLKVMSTAITQINFTDPLLFWWTANAYDQYIIYIHLAEVELLETNQKREFDISVNGNYIATVSPSTNITTIKSGILSGAQNYQLRLTRTINSTLPPILNAVEVYYTRQLLQTQTDDHDAAAIWSTKSSYGLKNLNWQGDPCVPEAWIGLNCSYDAPGVTKITSLNLSSRGLSGEITTTLANLTMLKSLDLSYNKLTGNVPKFLTQLKNLRTINLTGNNFSRPLPAELLEKSKKGLLQFSIEELNGAEDTSSCHNGSCSKKKLKIPHVVLILASIILCILILAIIVCQVKPLSKRAWFRIDGDGHPRKEKFTHSELADITKKFSDEIGRGGYGKVYHGLLKGEQVAVKVLLDQGDKKFQSEVKLLMKIHHKNITSLIGYCNDDNHKGFIYEFMAQGNLEKHLFDGSPDVLCWKRRIQIACDVAEGLAYIHHSCKQPIVHRDIKPSNILLNTNFQAKLADFGLSRTFTTRDESILQTENVGGTVGYLDPSCSLTRTLTTKSDVYSFGILLLVMITSRRAISDDKHIIDWVISKNGEMNVENIIDPRLDGIFDKGVALKVVKIAIECVSREPSKRPTMNDVGSELTTIRVSSLSDVQLT